jgi:hypothetical protein
MPTIRKVAFVIAAPHMRESAIRFRAEFGNDYLKQNKPYPIEKALRASRLRPSSAEAQKLLLRRKELEIKDGQISNNLGREVEAIFEPVLNDKSFTAAVLFPKPFEAAATFTNAELRVQFRTGLSVAFLTKPAIENASLLPDRAIMTSFVVTDAALTLEFDPSIPTDPGFIMVMAFSTATSIRALITETRPLGDEAVTGTPFANSAINIARRKNFEVIFQAAGACQGNGGGAPPPGQPGGRCTLTRVEHNPMGNTYYFDVITSGGTVEEQNYSAGNAQEATQMCEIANQ